MMAPRVMTVSGPIPPAELGFTLPHEHTDRSVAHPQRWDYWELTPDEPVIIEELARFRRRRRDARRPDARRGRARPGLARRLAGRDGPPHRHGLRLVSRGHYPAEALIDRRSVDDLADELVREATDGVAGDRRPPRDHRRDRDGQAVGRAQEERVHRAAARASRRTGLAITTHARPVDGGARSAEDLQRRGRRSGAGRHRPRRFPPRLDFHLAVSNRGDPPVRLPGDSFQRRASTTSRGWSRLIVRSWSAACRPLLCPRTSATTASSRRTAATATCTCTSTSCPPFAPRP